MNIWQRCHSRSLSAFRHLLDKLGHQIDRPVAIGLQILHGSLTCFECFDFCFQLGDFLDFTIETGVLVADELISLILVIDGLCLLAKRLEQGRFVWPQATEGCVSLTAAQLSMLLEGIDWRRPERTQRPLSAL